MFILDYYILVVLLVAIGAGIIIAILYAIFKNPFHFPYFKRTFDVTSKRNVDANDYIDNFLCDSNNWNTIQNHQLSILQWKKDTEAHLEKCVMKRYRTKQYRSILDDEQAYRFFLVRRKTRYKQINYVRTPYKVSMIDSEWAMSWEKLNSRHNKLAKIGFECTLKNYNSKEQRKLMTPELKQKIKVRDHYTCQICGKVMFDEVGLHIDHIIPIAKGGKSIPSNLRVLCSKCNGSKGAKIE